MSMRLIVCILILVGLISYRINKLKTIKLEKKQADSKVISLESYYKVSKGLLIFFIFDLIVEAVMSKGKNFSSVTGSELTIIFCFGMIIYATKESVKSTFIIRKNDFILFVNGEEKINFHDVKEINISNTANKYVYLITIFLKDGREYSIKGRDQYEMNKVVRLINEKIGYKSLKEELAKA
ncbi:hypothetical protein QTI69_09685 [Clostridium perfringens]|uniref:hypothetical protein n=1 Tax=Clostridium perfringens TaxID=1502 RepID=UPI002246AB81|nr:hypothetical protein [Clostridium perfringens]EHK2387797.1 hypothetical protein [Clostridium perfringens]EHK2404045.1 hypothetical protein [Clostridium perfringens]EJT5932812.1 hypothetical protein [Clostridium perfringens]EJT6557048.1 hypothetical protein [Clostridium perfringens]ELC8436211.1 hypothetical protein [Clostridium perfringens]